MKGLLPQHQMLKRESQPLQETRSTALACSTPQVALLHSAVMAAAGGAALPTLIPEVTVSSLTELVTYLERLPDAHSTVRWFRGCGAYSHKLVPSIFRHPTRDAYPDLADLEGELTHRFQQRSLPFLTRDLPDEWERLFVMQHFGVPTRLLDWTENPFLGLFFAVTSGKRKVVRRRPQAVDDAALWILEPARWNRENLNHMGVGKEILYPSHDKLDTYKPGNTVTSNAPAAIFGIYNSPRIVAQRGVFTLFGWNTQPQEDIARSLTTAPDLLRKIRIPKDAIDPLRHSLSSMGISDSVVFPDLDGLAREIKWGAKF